MRDVRGNSSRASPDTIVVGLKLTPESREMLSWVLAKVAQPGDQVIGIHILHSSNDPEFSEEEFDPFTKQQLDNTFQRVLPEYQGLCTLKEIQLDIKVVTGINLREGLVEAATKEKASKLILGSSCYQVIRWTNSFAQYYVKRLPPSCSVLVIHSGEVLLEKPGTYRSSGEHLPGAILRKSWRKLSHKKSLFSRKTMGSVDLGENYSNRTSTSLDSGNLHSLCSDEAQTSLSLSSAEKLSPDSPVSVLRRSANDERYQCPLGEKASAFLEMTKQIDASVYKPKEANTEAHDMDNEEKLGRPADPSNCGWPLMHRSISLEKLINSYSAARSLSVVKWALQLPDRPNLPLPSVRSRKDEHIIERDHDTHSELREVAISTDCDDQETRVLTDAIQKGIVCGAKVPVTSDLSGEEKGVLTPDEEFVLLVHRLDSLRLKGSCSRYNYEELEEATAHFSSRNLIGNGGYSQVYKGVLQDGQKIAVKCLREGSLDAEQELLTEVEILSTLRHRNIITLLGFCVNRRRSFLVYNLADEGNLDENLHGGGDQRVLEWSIRYKIAVGAARALEYLHDGCPKRVVHRDIKSSNILLTSAFEAQVSDFGLAKWTPEPASYITCTDIVGTFGYLAPEYFMFGKVNEKTDVYSFGVVLLELITGKKPIDISSPKGQENLVLWARGVLERQQFEELVDPKLKKYDENQLMRMIFAASSCIQQSPHSRPRMPQIFRFLSGETDPLIFSKVEDIQTIMGNEVESLSQEYIGSRHHDVCSHGDIARAFKGGDDDDTISECSTDQSCFGLATFNSSKTLEDYFRKRYSRSSSFE